MKPALTLLTLALGLSAVSSAAVIAINNGQFTSNNGGTATGWTDYEVGGTTYYAPGGAAPNGVAYLMGSGTSSSPNFNSIVQNLSTVPANSGLTVSTYTSYSIIFDAGFRNDSSVGTANMTVSLVDLGTNNTYQAASDVVLAFKNFSRSASAIANPVSAMTQEIANLSFTSSSTNNIALVFQNTTYSSGLAGQESWRKTGMIDNISVTSVPEPSAALLGGLGMLVLLRRRRH